MKKITLIAADEVVVSDVVDLLRRSGFAVEVMAIDNVTQVANSSVYIVWHDREKDTAGRWAALVGKPLLQRTVACGPAMLAKDMLRLHDLGVRYACDVRPSIAGLLRLIGYIDADMIAGCRERIEQARELAVSVFTSTTAAFGLFPSATSFDAAFYKRLHQEFEKRLQLTPLILLLDSIQSQQDTTIQHCSLVTSIAVAFGSILGFNSDDMERLYLAAFFHDIGKSVIPKQVIDKPGRLTAEEMGLMRSHVTVAYEMLRRFPETSGEIAEVALCHHEMLDGSGYPHGLSGSEIPDLVRLVTIADIFGALIERRAYKPPMPATQAYDILKDMGPKLDQPLVRAFKGVVDAVNA